MHVGELESELYFENFSKRTRCVANCDTDDRYPVQHRFQQNS